MKTEAEENHNNTKSSLTFKKRKFSCLGLVNKLLFQWLFVRLTKHQEKVITKYNLHSVDVSIGIRGFTEDIVTYQWYSIQYWVLPLTGWKTDYIYLNKKPNFIRVSKKIILAIQ